MYKTATTRVSTERPEMIIRREKPLYVHSPIYPDRAILDQYIDRIYDSGWLTNNGPLVGELESALARYLDVPFLVLTSNGTVALQLALKASCLPGEVITTPFTFPATGQAVTWCGYRARFADIDPGSLNLDPAQLSRHMGPETRAILPVNVYGTTHHTEELEHFAEQHGLKLIFDSAHCFGPGSATQKLALLSGTAATLSFHATKIFNTIEGGAVVTRDPELYKKAKALTNFGMTNGVPSASGTNAKMNEFEAAFGLANLATIDGHLAKRQLVTEWYQRELKPLADAGDLRIINSANYSYMPILFRNHQEIEPFEQSLAIRNIFGRRYFRPLQPGCEPELLPVASDAAERIYCLPMHSNVQEQDVVEICRILQRQLGKKDRKWNPAARTADIASRESRLLRC